ncbi:phosphotransferase family protein [Microbulbifer sp. CAU 1566]|uniref:choline/ethanolamine kinase family protein n=1 Tax=Microbulbifer sp. CAU 1566 TaxID=2933269 RepID=UPI002002B054|nr:choline/ethanolamine kinase family protein [Microbulbifer sp. CAU 1566]MCK7595957.1 phosphotransferase family protein [Microbulbifer sp. CAU 1566]
MNQSVEHLIASEWQRWSDRPPKLIRPLEGGLTNRSFLIDAGDKKLVLRINAPNSLALDLNRAAEAEALQQASPKDLCAPLVYVDPAHRYLLTQFVDGAPLDINQPQAFAQLAQLLRQIHQLPPISVQLDIADKADRYWQSIDRNTDFFPALAQLYQLMELQLKQSSARPENYRLCHNDLLPDNLLQDRSGQLRAIDWEYTACGDPFFDLATVTTGYDLDRQQQRALLSEYLLRPACEADLTRLDHWKRTYRYLSVLWYVVQFSHSPGSASPQIEQSALDTEITELLASFS